MEVRHYVIRMVSDSRLVDRASGADLRDRELV